MGRSRGRESKVAHEIWWSATLVIVTHARVTTRRGDSSSAGRFPRERSRLSLIVRGPLLRRIIRRDTKSRMLRSIGSIAVPA